LEIATVRNLELCEEQLDLQDMQTGGALYDDLISAQILAVDIH